jgi:hypothetical protein
VAKHKRSRKYLQDPCWDVFARRLTPAP